MEGSVEEAASGRADGATDRMSVKERDRRDGAASEARDFDPKTQDWGDDDDEEDDQGEELRPRQASTAGEVKCSVKIRRVAADPVELTFDPKRTRVSELKLEVATRTNATADEQKLVYAGRTLDSDRLLSEYGIKDGDSIHLVKVASNRAQEQASHQAGAPAATSAPLGGRNELLRQLSETPLMRSLTSNPELMRTVIMANPQMREMVERNPEIGHLMSDPSFLRQSMEMARNPELMREAMRSNDRMLSNIEMVPGGFNHLRRLYETMQQPLDSAGIPSNPSTDAANSEFARRLNVQDLQPGQLNQSALPNPWQPLPPRAPQLNVRPVNGSPLGRIGFPFTPMSMPTGLFGQPQQGTGQRQQSVAPSLTQFLQLQQVSGSAQPVPPPDARMLLEQMQNIIPTVAPLPPAEPAEVRFRTQLQSLEEMGFVSKDVNIRAIVATDGNLQAAVDYILRQA